jgi:hypothetical protein
MSPSKVNHFTIKDLSDREEEEISNKKIKKETMIRMINEIKKEVFKQVNEFRGYK